MNNANVCTLARTLGTWSWEFARAARGWCRNLTFPTHWPELAPHSRARGMCDARPLAGVCSAAWSVSADVEANALIEVWY